jgi:hypothetical protein
LLRDILGNVNTVVYPKPADNSDRSKTGYNGLLSPPCKEAMP